MLDTAVMLDVMADGTFAEAAQTKPGRLRIAVSEAFPAGTRGSLSGDVLGALRGTSDLLRSLGHEVVDADIDFRLRDVPVIVGLMFRGIRDFAKEIERPAYLGHVEIGRAHV